MRICPLTRYRTSDDCPSCGGQSGSEFRHLDELTLSVQLLLPLGSVLASQREFTSLYFCLRGNHGAMVH